MTWHCFKIIIFCFFFFHSQRGSSIYNNMLSSVHTSVGLYNLAGFGLSQPSLPLHNYELISGAPPVGTGYSEDLDRSTSSKTCTDLKSRDHAALLTVLHGHGTFYGGRSEINWTLFCVLIHGKDTTLALECFFYIIEKQLIY